MPSVRIAVEAWEVGAGDVNTEPMARLYHYARRPQVDSIFIDHPRRDGAGVRPRLTVAGADDTVSQILRIAIGAHIDKFGREIRIWSRRCGIELHRNQAGDFQRTR